jgi:2-polyprenyl-6-methoxyphenol hydroxylase-like FAD-dependent oxidoreductase
MLCVLYKNIRDKERLLVNQKVTRVENHEDRVVVHTAAGDVFEAQVIVGADGVRSTVRKEMWRNAEEAGVGVPAEDKKGQWKKKKGVVGCVRVLATTRCIV